jgi:hypothetical protein
VPFLFPNLTEPGKERRPIYTPKFEEEYYYIDLPTLDPESENVTGPRGLTEGTAQEQLTSEDPGWWTESGGLNATTGQYLYQLS